MSTTDDDTSSNAELPGMLAFAIHLGVEPSDVFTMLDCVRDRYREVLAKQGPAAARRWSRQETTYFLLLAAWRLIKSLNPLA